MQIEEEQEVVEEEEARGEDPQGEQNDIDPEIQGFYEAAIRLIPASAKPDDPASLVDENEEPMSVADREAPPPPDVEFTAAEIRSSFMEVILQPIFLQKALLAISKVKKLLLSQFFFLF